MNSGSRELVLFALTGLSPAVLTETIWALVHEDSSSIPDRIVVATTRTGRDVLVKRLFSEGCWDRFLRDLSLSAGVSLKGKLRFGNISDCIWVFRDDTFTRELEDIRSKEENLWIADFFLEKLRSFTENDHCDLIVSIAGGRKTMGALLHSVVSLTGRETDRVTHVLVDDPWDRIPGFLYPGSIGSVAHPETGMIVDSITATVSLADLPFVPMRYLFEKEIRSAGGSYTQLVGAMRRSLDDIDQELFIRMDPVSGSVWVDDKQLVLSGREFSFLYYFADRRVRGLDPLTSFSDLSDAEWNKWIQSNRHLKGLSFDHWTMDADRTAFDPGEDSRKIANSIRSKLGKIGLGRLQQSRIVPNRGSIGMSLPPSSISIIQPKQP